MTITGKAGWALLITVVLGGCPLIEDPQAVDGTADTSDDPATGDGPRDDPADGDPADHKPTDDKPGDDEPADGDMDGGVDAEGDDLDSGPSDTGLLDASPLDASSPDAGPPDAGPEIIVPDLGAADMLDADRATLISNHLTAEGYEANWKPLLESSTARRALVVTPSHGSAVRVFVNDVAYYAVREWERDGMPLPLEMPNGSIVVKQTFKQDATTLEYALSGTLIMAKIDVLDEVMYEGDWFYMRVSLENVPSRSTTCVNCHNGRTASAVWPPNPEIVGDKGGLADGIVPYDYLFLPFCADPNTAQCAAPP